MGKRDHYTKRLLDDPKVVADIFKYLMFRKSHAVLLNNIQRLDGEHVRSNSRLSNLMLIKSSLQTRPMKPSLKRIFSRLTLKDEKR